MTERGDLSKALHAVIVGISIYPDNANLYNAQSNLDLQLGRAREALLAADRALQLEPTHAYAHVNRGMAHDRLGNHAQAAADYALALSFLPQQDPLRPQVEQYLAAVKKRAE